MASKNNRTRFALLGFLTWKPMTGYDLRKLIESSVGNFWQESYGQIYPILRQLEAEGLVTMTLEPQEGRPARKVHALTDAGRAALDAWLGESPEYRPSRNELLLKLFFARGRPPSDARAHVGHFRDLQERLLARYEAIENRLAGRNPRDPDLPYWRFTLSYGQHVSRALLAWCDETLATLERLERGREGKERPVPKVAKVRK